MFEFMFSWLGSAMFWFIFLAVNFSIGSILIKYTDKNAWHYFETGEFLTREGYGMLKEDVWTIGGRCCRKILFWYVYILSYIIYFTFKLFFCKLLFPIIKKGIFIIGSSAPDIEIKKKEEE